MVGEKPSLWFTLVVLAALLAGCSAASNRKTATPTAPPGVINRTIVTATRALTEEATRLAYTATPKPHAITVKPPKLPVEAVPRSPADGWQTFTSPALGVAVDYPKDWSVAEINAVASYTSPQGSIILLEAAQSLPDSSLTGQDCAKLINAYGQPITTCLDASASRYSAVLKMPAGAPTAWVVLSTISAEKPVVFLKMFDSLRPLP